MKWRAIGAGGVLAAVVGGAALWVAQPLPEDLLEPAGRVVTLEDRFGRELRTTRAPDGSRGGWLRLEEIDADVIAAFVAVEDHRFYRHWGVDPRSVARAA